MTLMLKNIAKLMPDIGMLRIESNNHSAAMTSSELEKQDYSTFTVDELDSEPQKNPLNVELRYEAHV